MKAATMQSTLLRSGQTSKSTGRALVDSKSLFAPPFGSRPGRGSDGSAVRSFSGQVLENERQQRLTILFSDLSNSVQIGEAMEADRYVALLRVLRRHFRRIVAGYGGHIARMQGDGVLAFFRSSTPGADDGWRAAACALEMHAAVRATAIRQSFRANGPLALHSGIHAGISYLERGDVERGRFDLLGNVPNIAARLSSLAGSDQIYISEEALGQRNHQLATSGRLLLKIRGWSDPVAAYVVLDHGVPYSRPSRDKALNRWQPRNVKLGLKSERSVRSDRRHWAPRTLEKLTGPHSSSKIDVQRDIRRSGSSRSAEARVLIVDDHLMFLQGLKTFLGELAPELRLDTSGDLSKAVRLARLGTYDLVLLDWHLADCDGEESIRRLRSAGCAARIVVLSGENSVALVQSTVKLGVVGFIPKTYTSEMMIFALHQVLAGDIFLPAEAIASVSARL
jgi:class 3 adenylate cyclase/ActR/RegA family two-component response regulator